MDALLKELDCDDPQKISAALENYAQEVKLYILFSRYLLSPVVIF